MPDGLKLGFAMHPVLYLVDVNGRQYGPLTEDLIAVLLRSEPGARPTASQVLAIPAVRPYADAYVRRMRDVAERCTSPTTPLSAHVADTRTGSDVTPEPQLGDGAKCIGKSENQCRTCLPTALAGKLK